VIISPVADFSGGRHFNVTPVVMYAITALPSDRLLLAAVGSRTSTNTEKHDRQTDERTDGRTDERRHAQTTTTPTTRSSI